LIDHRGLAMVHVGNDGDVADLLAHDVTGGKGAASRSCRARVC
jgi:hypothetical protein